eukprot:TRINITY_DN14948_c0_g1_i1.p1 TRINITY_DN14948_c0_g1~~TRINITY_DN14948_c0_g1_i1.p1  ORF type:complete len:104 (-),score=8.64 TRINITY_DN14948_c0_g1_i1:1561-1872(-)
MVIFTRIWHKNSLEQKERSRSDSPDSQIGLSNVSQTVIPNSLEHPKINSIWINKQITKQGEIENCLRQIRKPPLEALLSFGDKKRPKLPSKAILLKDRQFTKI